jgi:group I intron endonuclease
MSSLSKRPAQNSGSSGAKRQRLSSDEPDILETKESEALIEQVDGDVSKFRTGCIYLLTCIITGLVYVGQSIEYKKRMKEHGYSGKNPKFYLSYAIRKYGWENFTKEILIDDVPEEDLDNLEINYIDFYNSFNREKGYNLTIGGGGMSGYRHTEEQRMAKSKACTRNHNVEGGGSISFHKGRNKWVVVACNTNNKHIGHYFTKDKAIAALKLYNETGTRMDSDTTRRKMGTGCITENSTKTKGKRYRGKIKINEKTHYTKRYGSREKAQSELEKLRSKFL